MKWNIVFYVYKIEDWLNITCPDVVVESREMLPNPEPGGNEPKFKEIVKK